jgi:RNA polymerase sigma factor (sigma-70 family)
MSSFDPKKQPAPRQEFTTANGVKVIVAPPPPKPPRRPPPEPRPPPIVVFPPNQPAAERQAFMDSLARQYGRYIVEKLEQKGVVPESAKDLAQDLILVVCEAVEKIEDPEKKREVLANMRGYIAGVVNNAVRDHRDLARNRKLVPDDGLAEAAAASSASDPEKAAIKAERKRKLQGYIRRLPQPEGDVIRCLDIEEMSYKATASKLGLPVGTLSTVRRRAFGMMQEMAAEIRRRRK